MVFLRLGWQPRLENEAGFSTTVRATSAETPADLRDPYIGSTLRGRYRVLKRLGQGSAGVVYLAEHVVLRRPVAVKVMLPQLTAAGEAYERFRREANISRLVRNPHVVEVTELGQLPGGSPFLVMEYLKGTDVARLIAAEGPLCVPRVAEIGLQICSALEAVHRAGVVHRDLKPEHVFLTGPGDFVKVVDFGICKVSSSHALTGAGIALGTPRFMAPEQLEARPDVDARVDLYALGGILFYMLTGHCPFDAGTLPALLLKVWSEPAPHVGHVRADVPATLDSVIDRALSKDPNARPCVREFQAALTPFAPSRSADA